MTNKEHLINQHILEYESRLKHIDELIGQAEQKQAGQSEQAAFTEELKQAKAKRDELEDYVHSVKKLSVENWEKDEINLAGPMAVWDVVAQQLAKLLEKDKKPE